MIERLHFTTRVLGLAAAYRLELRQVTQTLRSESDSIAKHHQFTPLRAAHAAAQQSFLDLDKDQAIKEVEAILKEKEANHGN